MFKKFNLKSPANISLSIRKSFALFLGDIRGDLLDVPFDEMLQVEHPLLAR